MFVVVEEGGRVSNPPLRPRWERPARWSDRYEQDSQPGPWFDRLTTNVGLDSPFAGLSAGSELVEGWLGSRDTSSAKP